MKSLSVTLALSAWILCVVVFLWNREWRLRRRVKEARFDPVETAIARSDALAFRRDPCASGGCRLYMEARCPLCRCRLYACELTAERHVCLDGTVVGGLTARVVWNLVEEALPHTFESLGGMARLRCRYCNMGEAAAVHAVVEGASP